MIRRKDECAKELKPNMRGGDGTVKLTALIKDPQELNGHGRLFSIITLEPGCSIGFHMHESESELFCILEGEPEYCDNGTWHRVVPGDVTICAAGTGHAIRNSGEKTVRLVALILYA